MMLALLPLSLLVGLSLAQGTSQGSCSFSKDCQAYRVCQGIQDASCVCNFGRCIIDGNPFFRGSECDRYTDCSCSGDPANCFCRDGTCTTTPWECHEPSDCNGMAKCQGKQCACQGNLCAFDCFTTADCADNYCNKANGYECECRSSLCEFKKKAEECPRRTITECIDKGLCREDLPCACTNKYCADPWWVAPDGNCRSDQDCEKTVAACSGGRCTCADKVARNRYEQRGTCKVKTSRSEVKTKNDNSRIYFGPPPS